MLKSCERCGKDYPAKASRQRFCSDTCRKAWHKRQPATSPRRTPSPRSVSPDDEGLTLYAATYGELFAVNATSSASGRSALVLARIIDEASSLNGAATAALVKEMRACIAEAIRASDSTDPDTPLTRLRARHAAGIAEAASK